MKTKGINMKKVYRRRRITFLSILTISIISMIVFSKMMYIALLSVDYSEAIYSGLQGYANYVYSERLAMQGDFFYELPYLLKLTTLIASGAIAFKGFQLIYSILKLAAQKGRR